jgi:integrase
MAAVSLPNVKEIRPGYFVFCKKVRGKQRYSPLPKPTDPKFAAAYAKARASFEKPAPDAVAKGTFSALIVEYRASADYDELSAATKANYEPYIQTIEARMGKAPVKDLKASRVEKMRDELLSTPGKANNWLKILRTLLDLGVRRDYVTHNAAAPVQMLKLGEHLPWPQEVIDRFFEDCSPTTRLAIETGLYSGQRIGDCIRITHKMMATDTVHLVQGKKRSKGQREIEVFIPIHPGWRAAVARVERRAETILYDRYGRPFRDPGPLQERIRDRMKALGYVDENGEALYTFHGLRKNAANYLKEMGLTDAQIGAICGMSAETVAHYTKGVNRRLLAESSRDRIVSGDVTTAAAGLQPVRSGVTARSGRSKKS